MSSCKKKKISKIVFHLLSRTEVLFVKAIYGGPFINETLMLNLRQYQREYARNKKIEAMEMEKEFERRYR